MDPTLIGRTLSRYRVVERLGEGGMGVVYRAWDERLERDVALKVLSPSVLDAPSARSRLRQEAKTLSRLDHPAIATVLDFDTHEGIDFVVMEFVRGQTLAERLARAPFEEPELLAILAQVCEALDSAHEQGVIHSDLKPANVMVTARGRVKVLDFGLATVCREDTTSLSRAPTQTITLGGTVPYMAPEQLFGQAVDARTDVFALGAVLYELVTGQAPFRGPVATAIADAILHQPVTPPSRLRPGLSPGFEALVLRCLEKRPDDRYPSARALADDVARLVSGNSGLARYRAPAPRIAVLPLADMGHDPGQEGLAEALTEALIAELASGPGLHVVPRTSVLRYRGTQRPLPEIARELDVDALVEGATWNLGERVRVSVRLIRGANDEQMWADRLDRPRGDALATQDDLACTIAREVRARLVPATAAAPGAPAARPVDPEANGAYARGRRQWNKRTRAGLEQAIALFEQAIDRDPSYAPAFSGLADCYAILAPWMPPRLGYQKAKAAARRAIGLDPTLAEAHTSLAFAQLFGDWDWAASEAGFRRALALDPGYATGHQWYAEYLSTVGRFDEALVEAHAAEELDALSNVMPTTLVNVYYYARRFEEALEYHRRLTVFATPAGSLSGIADRARLLEQSGRAAEAVTEYLAVIGLDDDPRIRAGLACAYAVAGRPDESRAELARLDKIAHEHHVAPYAVAGPLALLGDHDAAFAKLEQAFTDRDRGMVWLRVNPRFDSLRPDPRFAALLQRMNYPS